MPSLLTVDCGNSTYDLRLVEVDGRELRRQRQVELDLQAFLQQVTPLLVLVSSVRQERFERLSVAVADIGSRLLRAGADLGCPLDLRYPDPKELGVDRWLGALAAKNRFGDSIVVDCGTAVTWNLVSTDGVFHGGAIALGLRSQIRALRTETPALPAIDPEVGDPDRPRELPAVTTRDALWVGVGRGFALAVVGLVRELCDAAGCQRARRLLTGGDAALLRQVGGAGGLLDDFTDVPDLVHLGLFDLARAALDDGVR